MYDASTISAILGIKPLRMTKAAKRVQAVATVFLVASVVGVPVVGVPAFMWLTIQGYPPLWAAAPFIFVWVALFILWLVLNEISVRMPPEPEELELTASVFEDPISKRRTLLLASLAEPNPT